MELSAPKGAAALTENQVEEKSRKARFDWKRAFLL
jgi:hypothetical protein